MTPMSPATKILRKAYAQQLIKAARGHTYAPKPPASAASTTAPSPVSRRVGARRGTGGRSAGIQRNMAARQNRPATTTEPWLLAAGSAIGNAGLNTARTGWNTISAIPTFASGVANAAGGGVGNVISGIGYGIGTATDALGVTNGAQQWVADNMWKHTNNAVWGGLQDVGGAVADAATGGMYDYDGTFAEHGTHPGTAVQQNRAAIRNELRQTAGPAASNGLAAWLPSAENVFDVTNGVSDFASSSLAFGGLGRGVNVASQAIKGAPQAAAVLNSASRAPVVGPPLAAAGKWLSGPAPAANMFANSPVQYYRNIVSGGVVPTASAITGEMAEIYDAHLGATFDPVQAQQERAQQIQQDQQRREEFAAATQAVREISNQHPAHEHAVTNAMMNDPAILNRIHNHQDHLPPAVIADIAREQISDPAKRFPAAVQSVDNRLQQMQKDNASAGEINAYFDQLLEVDLSELGIQPAQQQEFKQQVTDIRAQLGELDPQGKQQAAAAIQEPNGAAAQQLRTAAAEQAGQQAAAAAAAETPANPQEYGAQQRTVAEAFTAAVDAFNKMDPMLQIGAALGVGTGLLGVFNALGSGSMGAFLLGALGLSAGGLAAAAGGMFGDAGSQFAGNMLYDFGSMAGMVPKSEPGSLSKLYGADAVKNMAAAGGTSWHPEEIKKQIAEAQSGAAKLQQLMALPVPDEIKIQFMRRVDPGIKTMDDARQVFANAQEFLAAYADPNSDLNRKMQMGTAYVDTAENVQNLGNQLVSGINNLWSSK